MIKKQEIKEHLEGYCKELRLPAIRKNFEDDAREANLKNYDYEEFLYYLLQKESDLRRKNGKKNRIRLAGFPSKKYLEDLVVEDLPEDARKKLKLLSSLEFIKTGQNVILAGNAGTGNYRKNLLMERN